MGPSAASTGNPAYSISSYPGEVAWPRTARRDAPLRHRRLVITLRPMNERINVDHARWQSFSTNATHGAFDPDPRARAVDASISASSAFAQDVVGRLLTATAFTRWGIAHSDNRVEHPAAVRELRV